MATFIASSMTRHTRRVKRGKSPLRSRSPYTASRLSHQSTGSVGAMAGAVGDMAPSAVVRSP
jgi:hypothetical protein